MFRLTRDISVLARHLNRTPPTDGEPSGRVNSCIVPDIVLATLNARYAHASFGLRYLMANLPEELRERAGMLEFDISQRAVDVVERILDQNPKIVGLEFTFGTRRSRWRLWLT